MTVADVKGVQIAGSIFDAGPVNSPALLLYGNRLDLNGHGRHDHNGSTRRRRPDRAPRCVLPHRRAARRQGAHVSLVVNRDNTILDHIWAWRADHGSGVGWTTNTADHGVVVNGDNVVATGLFAEHYQKYNVFWAGENGKTIMFQNEMPYDPPNQAAWQHDGVLGWAAYKVADSVKTHEGWGLGSYCFFNVDPTIHASRAFEVPVTPGVKLHDILTLSITAHGTIDHVVNDVGAADAPRTRRRSTSSRIRSFRCDERPVKAGLSSVRGRTCKILSYCCSVAGKLADVAKQAGVSEATVSRVLNGKPGISDATRAAVLTALDVIGYERPTHLRVRRARMVGLVVPELQNPIFPALAEVVAGALAQRGFNAVLCTRTGSMSEAEYVEMLLERQVSGMVFAGGQYAEADAPHDHYARLLKLRLPVVLVNAAAEHLDFPRVSTDDAVAMEQAHGHLAYLGHERIGLILGPSDHVPSRRKLAAFEAIAERATGSHPRSSSWSARGSPSRAGMPRQPS